MNYYTTSVIHLSLEGYYNKGMTSDEARAAIEKIVNPHQRFMYSSGDTLRCEAQGINGNWNVHVMTTNPHKIHEVVEIIDDALYRKCTPDELQTRKGAHYGE